MNGQREDEQLTEYLAPILAALSNLPASEREEAYHEFGQHVESLVEEEVRAGGDREGATQAALKKFGDPKRIAELIYRERRAKEWHRRLLDFGPPMPIDRIWELFVAFTITPVTFLLTNMPLLGWPAFAVSLMIGLFCGATLGLAREFASKRIFAWRGLSVKGKGVAKGKSVTIGSGWLVLSFIACMSAMALVFRIFRDWHHSTSWAPALLGSIAMVIVLRYFLALYKKMAETFGVKE